LFNYGTIHATGTAGDPGYSIEACACSANNSEFTNMPTGVLDGQILVLNTNNKVTNYGLITITDPSTPIAPFNFTIQNQAQDGTNPDTFEQKPSGTLALRMNNAGAIDSLLADVVVARGTLRVVIQNQLYPQTLTSTNPAVDVTPNFAAAGAPFDRYTSSSPFLTATPIYDGGLGTASSYHSIDIQLDRIPFDSVPGLTPNERAVGSALEAGYEAGATGNAAKLLGYVFGATSIGVLDQLSGQGTTALQGASFSLGTLFSNMMQSQALNGDLTGTTSVVIPPAQYAEPRVARGHEAFASLKPSDPPIAQPGRWRIWTLGFGASRYFAGDSSAGIASQSISSFGGALGFDHQIGPDLLLGFAAGGSESSVSVKNLATSGRIDGGHIGFYGVKTWGQAYAAANISYARLDNSTIRSISAIAAPETANGRFPADQFSARFEFGWKQTVAHYTLTPFVAVEPAVLWQHAYGETTTTPGGGPGLFGLSYLAHTVTSLPTFLGLQADTRTVLANGTAFTPYARASWVHEFEPNRQVTAAFINLPTGSFTVDGARAARDAARIDAGAKLEIDARASLFGNLSGEWSGISQAYAATAGFRVVQ
jgi:uncharacterized protein with beta-barrel porin domain